MDFAIFRQMVEEEIRSRLVGGRSPLFGLEAMNAYHMGLADQQGNVRDSVKGKYMRSIFCLALCAGLGGDPQKAVPAAASLELVHRTSLIFDDIQDQGIERNGQPTMWEIWGVNQAINAGLELSSHARLAAQRGIETGILPEKALRILNVLENAVINLCEGQFLDLSFQDTVNVTEEDYFRMVRGKTGALFGAACEVGAICADANSSVAERARDFGIRMGVAFQAHDDYLGIWGDEAKVGKTANDLTEKKRSLPVVVALQKSPRQMRNWLKLSKIPPDLAGTIRYWMEDMGIQKATRTIVEDLASRAREPLNEMGLDPACYNEIDKFLSYAVERKI
jgi:geranylgeranyl diphosphate synthase type I